MRGAGTSGQGQGHQGACLQQDLFQTPDEQAGPPGLLLLVGRLCSRLGAAGPALTSANCPTPTGQCELGLISVQPGAGRSVMWASGGAALG